MKKLLILTILLTGFLFSLCGDNISISGLDTGRMMFDGSISLYLNITDDGGMPKTGVTADELTVEQSLDNSVFHQKKITAFSEGINKERGINFQLLIDNSGSMYDTVSGNPTDIYEETRIYSAISAIRTLINSMQGSRDKAGISLFNTYFKELTPVSSNRSLVLESLQLIEKPGKDESFTELNGSIVSASNDFSTVNGRKIIIVLSDGENYPYSKVRNEDSPQFGADLFSTDDMVDSLKKSSTTLYAINFGSERDRSLEKAVIETGGFLYEASDESELASIYKDIRDRVLSEYYVEFVTDTEYADRKFVKASLKTSKVPSGTVYYYSGNLFGSPSDSFNPLVFIASFLSLILLGVLAFLKLSSPAEKPELEIKDSSGSTQMFNIENNKTVIGSSERDDITIATERVEDESNATIVFDEKKSAYTVVSDKEVLVNNTPVKTRVLEPGDVINIDGATIIFNDKE